MTRRNGYDWGGLGLLLFLAASASIPVIGFALGYEALGYASGASIVVLVLAVILADAVRRWRDRRHRHG